MIFVDKLLDMWNMNSLFSKITSVVFPKRCFVCKKEENSICKDCLATCKYALDPPHLFITSAYSFHDAHIRKMIHACKYYHRKDLIEPLSVRASELVRKKLAQFPDVTNWILVPIPMTPMRKLLRGYNQAEIIAHHIASILSLPLETAFLFRKKHTARQVLSRTRHKRMRNQYGSFGATENVIGKYIILVDDVTTTGATLLEARTVLLEHGAAHVLAVTLAH